MAGVEGGNPHRAWGGIPGKNPLGLGGAGWAAWVIYLVDWSGESVRHLFPM